MKLESVLHYVDGYLGVSGHPDYPTALNGLQVGLRVGRQVGGGRGVDDVKPVRRVAAAVDASLASIRAAREGGADLLLVHHGLFWGGLQPLTGPHLERVSLLIEGEIALYSCHLPLDAHAEVGNCALLARAIDVEPTQRFAGFQGIDIGWWGEVDPGIDIEALEGRVRTAVEGNVHVIPGGPDEIRRVGVVTGGGASFAREAAALGLDALVTGEGPHHTHFDAMEGGIHVLFGGHYATETFGVRALAGHLADRFGLSWFFIDQPTGL
jgi:dinuclear metal center YbgI/SA1388 family protein